MNGKILMSLGLCLMFGLTMVSAATISNVETNYDKKTNQITVDYDITVYKECVASTFRAFDHKGNQVATSAIPWVPGQAIPISCMMNRYGVPDPRSPLTKTGTFHKSYVLDVADKRDIKGLGNLEFKITHHSGLIGEGRL